MKQFLPSLFKLFNCLVCKVFPRYRGLGVVRDYSSPPQRAAHADYVINPAKRRNCPYTFTAANDVTWPSRENVEVKFPTLLHECDPGPCALRNLNLRYLCARGTPFSSLRRPFFSSLHCLSASALLYYPQGPHSILKKRNQMERVSPPLPSFLLFHHCYYRCSVS